MHRKDGDEAIHVCLNIVCLPLPSFIPREEPGDEARDSLKVKEDHGQEFKNLIIMHHN